MERRYNHLIISHVLDFGLLFLRVIVSLLMIIGHGIPKVLNPQSHINLVELAFRTGPLSPILAYLSIAAETLFQVFILFGVFTRVSSLISSINMFFALIFLIFIRGVDFPNYEKALLYFAIYVFFVFGGAGRYSLDGLINRR